MIDMKTMTKLKFAGRITSMGDRKMIIIPKDYHNQLPKNNQIMVEIEGI
jgi:hypothetical protein